MGFTKWATVGFIKRAYITGIFFDRAADYGLIGLLDEKVNRDNGQPTWIHITCRCLRTYG